MNRTFWQAWAPHLLITLLFFLISAIYFSPILGGKVLRQSDITNYKAMSKEIQDHREEYGEEPLWTNSAFGGMPAYQISMRSPGNLFNFLRKLLPRPISFLFFAMLGAYLMLLAFDLNRWIALAGALAYGLNTYLITFIEAGHNSKSEAVAWMPFVIAGLHLLFKGRTWPGLALSALGLTMELTVNHVQITYYLFLAIGVWGVVELIFAIREGRLPQFGRAVGAFALVTVLAVGANATRILTTLEYSDWTIRGPSELVTERPEGAEGKSGLDRDYAFAWSYGLGETMTLMFPNFAGGSTMRNFVSEEDSETLTAIRRLAGNDQNMAQQLAQLGSKYWGPLGLTSGPIYIGAIICFLFFAGCIVAPARYRWWLIAATLLSLFLSWGRHFPAFNYFLFDHLPLYNKFRTPMMAAVIANLTAVVMAAMALQHFLFGEAGQAAKRKALMIAGGVSAFFVLMALTAGALFEPLSPRDQQVLADNPNLSPLFDALKADRSALIRMDALRSQLFIALAFTALWFAIRGQFKALFAGIAIALLVFLDLISIDRGYLNNENFVEDGYYEAYFNQNLPVIQDQDPHFRVLNTNARPDQDGLTSWRFHSIGGYHGAKSRRYQDLVSRHNFSLPRPILNMLNTRYVIGRNNQAQRNPQALGNAWLVDSLIWVQSADEEIIAMDDLDPNRTVVVREEDRGMLEGFQAGGGRDGSISLTGYKANEMRYSVNLPSTRLAVFSEIWYRGNQDWKASLNGEPVDHFRANYILRAMTLPAGQHELVFRFDPPTFTRGNWYATMSSALLWLIILGAGLLGWRNFRGSKYVEEKVTDS